MDDVSLIYAEKHFIAYLLQNRDQIVNASVSLFYSDTGRAIITAIKHLHSQNATINTANIMTHISASGKSAKKETIDSLFSTVVTESDYRFFIDSLKKAGVQQELQTQVLPDIIHAVSTKGEFDLDAIRTSIKQVNALVNQDLSETKIYDGVTAIQHYENTLQMRRSGEYFYSSGDSYLDSRLTVGFAPGTQTVIFGTTGSGKTNFALSLFLKMIHKRIPCLYVSLEMPVDMLLDRLFAAKYQLPLAWLYPQANEWDTVPEWVFEKLALFRIEMQKNDWFRIIDEACFSLAALEDIIERTKREMGVNHLNVFIDLTTMMDEFTVSGTGSRADTIEVGVNRLNAIAKRYGCHIINIVQSNRQQDSIRLNSLDDINKLYPTLNNIKSSNALAERARLVLGIFRPKYYAERYFADEAETEVMDDVLHVAILKQSQGALGELTYLFAGEMASIYKFDQIQKPARVSNATSQEESREEQQAEEEAEEEISGEDC